MLMRTGLGASWSLYLPHWLSSPVADEATIAACSNDRDYNLWYPGCWAYSLDAWKEMAQFKRPSMPPAPGVPEDLRYPAPSGEAPETAIDALLADQMRNWQAQNQELMNSQPYVDESATTSPWLIAALVAGGAGLLMAARN